MTLNSKEFVETIIEHASTHGFPVDTDRQPNFWKITEKGGSFETRFTQMLCWYLDPQSNHGLGIDAVQTVLDASMGEKDSERLILDPSSTRVLAEEYLGYEIKGKFGKLDALVIDKKNQILVAIEVKMAADDHSSQLEKYHASIIRDYSDFPVENMRFIYLTPTGKESTQLADSWVPRSYGILSGAIEDSLRKLAYSPDSNSTNAMRIRFIVEDFYLMLKEKGLMYHEAIRTAFLDGEKNFIYEVAHMVHSLGISMPGRIRLRLNGLGVADEEEYFLSKDFAERSFDFRKEVESLYIPPNNTPKHLREVNLGSIMKSIWQVLEDKKKSRGKSDDLDSYMEMSDMSGVQKIAKWLRDDVRDTPINDGSSKIMVEAQDAKQWAIGFGHADTLTMPKTGARFSFVRFAKKSATIYLEPYGTTVTSYDDESIIAMRPDLFEKLQPLKCRPRVGSDDQRIRFRVSEDEVEAYKEPLLELFKLISSIRNPSKPLSV